LLCKGEAGEQQAAENDCWSDRFRTALVAAAHARRVAVGHAVRRREAAVLVDGGVCCGGSGAGSVFFVNGASKKHREVPRSQIIDAET
jgi:hypothetical protein